MEKMFRTNSGSEYYLNKGIWERRKSNGEIEKGVIYVGSINPVESTIFSLQEGNYSLSELWEQICKKEILGFIPKMKEGNVPFGFLLILGGLENIQVEEKKLCYKDGSPLKFAGVHLGHEIEKIYVPWEFTSK